MNVLLQDLKVLLVQYLPLYFMFGWFKSQFMTVINLYTKCAFCQVVFKLYEKDKLKWIRPILEAVLKQGVLRLFQHGLVRLGTPVLDEENISVLEQLYWWYLIKDNFKVKENIKNNLNN